MKQTAIVIAITLGFGSVLCMGQATKPLDASLRPGGGARTSAGLTAAPSTAPAPAQNNNGLNVRINAAGAVAPANGVDDAWARQQQQQIQQQKQMCTRIPEAGACRQNELVKIALVRGCLDVDPGSFDFKLGQNRINVEGSPATWIVNTNLSGPKAEFHGGGDYFRLVRYDWDNKDNEGIWQTSLSISAGNIAVNGQGGQGLISYSQHHGGVTLIVTEPQNGQFRQIVNITRQSLVEMQAEKPEEVRKYLAPLLLRLAGHQLLKPGDIYGVFTEIQPDPAVMKHLTEIISRLDAEEFSAREKASADLETLGAPGVLAAMRVDQDQLSVEQKIRLNAFINSARQFAPVDLAAARKDVNFLFQAMDDADPAVAAAAQKSLDALVGRPVQADRQQDPAKHAQATAVMEADIMSELKTRSAHPTKDLTTNPVLKPVQ